MFWVGFALTVLGGLSALLRSEPLAFLVDLRSLGLTLVLVGLALSGFALWRRRTRLRLAGAAAALALGTLFVASSYFAYRTVDVRFPSGPIELSGSLLVPRGAGPHPAVILMHGASPSFSVRAPYRLFADYFARQGIAALIYDKRSFGASGGQLPFAYEELARDAEAAFSHLSGRSDIDPTRIGLWGISEGGWTASLAASRLPEAVFLVVVSGAGVPPSRTVQWEMEMRLRAAGFPAEDISRALVLRERVDDYFRNGQGAEVWDDVHRVKVEPWFQAAFEMPPHEVPATIDDLPSDRADYRQVLDFDALPLLARLDLPLLFIFGAADLQVPAEESATAIREALDGREEVRIEIFPDTNHVLMTPTSRFAPGFLELMTEWISSVVSQPTQGV